MIRVLLAEDQALLRGALVALLGLEDDITVVGSVADGESAWRELQRLQPDVLVTDIGCRCSPAWSWRSASSGRRCRCA